MMNIIHSLTGTGHKDEHKAGDAHHDSATHTTGTTHTGSGLTGSSHTGTAGVTSAETAGTGAAPLGHSGTSSSHHTGTGVLGSQSSTTTGTGHTGTHTGLTGVGGAPQPMGEGTNMTKNFGHAQDGTYGGNVDNGRPAYRQGAEETIAGVLPGRNTGQQPMGQGTDMTKNFGHAQDGTYGGNVDNPRPVGGDNTASSNIAGVPASGLPGQHAATGGQASSHSGTGGILNKVAAASGLTGAANAISGTHSHTGDHSQTSHTGDHSSSSSAKIGLGSSSHTSGSHHHGTGTGIVGVSDATGPGSATSGQNNLGTRLTGESGVVSSSSGQHTSGHHHNIGENLGSSQQYDTRSSITGATSDAGLTGSSAFGSTTGASTADRYKESVGTSGALATGQQGTHTTGGPHFSHTHSTAAPSGTDGLFDSHAGQPGGIRGEHTP